MEYLLIPVALGFCVLLVRLAYKVVKPSDKEIQVKYLKEKNLEDLERLLNDAIKKQWILKGTTFYADGVYIIMIAKEI